MNNEASIYYDDPYSEILNKVFDALNEANLHNQQMSEPEYELFTAVASVIKERDPHANVPTMS